MSESGPGGRGWADNRPMPPGAPEPTPETPEPATASDRKRSLLISIGGTAGVLVLAAASLFAGMAAGAPRPAPTEVPTEPVPQRAEPGSVVSFPIATCTLGDTTDSNALGDFRGTVVDISTGETVYDRGGDDAGRVGTAQMLLTGMAALQVLGPDHRIATQVVRGEPGTVYLVGGGDVTLTAAPATSLYRDAASIAELAEQAKAAYYGSAGEPAPDELGGTSVVPLRTIVLDASAWAGKTTLDSWGNSTKRGTLPMMTALMVDGDREDPSAERSPRGDDPVSRAGAAFVDGLDLQLAEGEEVQVSTGSAPEGATVLATVESPPVSQLVTDMLQLDDETIAEALAREISIAEGGDGSFASATDAVRDALEQMGVPVDGIDLSDGSGTGTSNVVPIDAFVDAVQLVYEQRSGVLGPLWDALPVAGESGTLAELFEGGDRAAVAGKLTGVSAYGNGVASVSGILLIGDSQRYAVSLTATTELSQRVPRALANVMANVLSCGPNLTDH